MAKIFPFKYFNDLIFHSISNVKRIKNELGLAESVPAIDYAGFAVLKMREGEEHGYFLNILKGVLRDSDVVFTYDDLIYLFLPGTDSEGVDNLIMDFKEFYGNTFDFIYNSFLIKEIDDIPALLDEINNRISEKGWLVS